MAGRASAIQRLQLDDVIDAFRLACASGPMPLAAAPSRSAARIICSQVDDLLVKFSGEQFRAAGLDPFVGVAAAITVAVAADIAGTAVPGAGPAGARYLLHLAQGYASRHGMPLDADPDAWSAHVAALDGTPERCRAFRIFVQGCLSGSLPPLAPPEEAAFSAFVAVPVTDRDGPGLGDSMALARYASVPALDHGADLRNGQPVFRIDPTRPAAAVATLDFDALVASDVVIVVVPVAACGLGVVVELSARNGALVLVAVPVGTPVTPLIDGHPGDVTVAEYSRAEDVEAVVTHYLAERSAQAREVAAHRSRRASRWTAELATVRAPVRRNGPVGESRTWPADLVEQALRSVDHFAAASTDMTGDLARAAASGFPDAGLSRGRPIMRADVEALQRYAASRHLSEARYVSLLVEGSLMLATAKRRGIIDEKAWQALDEGMAP
jgi:hypothetical protein